MTDDIDLQESPELAYVHPGFTWRGHTFPIPSMSHKLLMAQASKPGDAFFIRVFLGLYIFIHPTEKVQRETQDKDTFRTDVLKWVDSLNVTEEDLEEAESVFVKAMEASNRGRVVPVSAGGTPTGKT